MLVYAVFSAGAATQAAEHLRCRNSVVVLWPKLSLCIFLSSCCSCYYISPDKKTWDESRKDCQARKANLVIIDSREEQALIKAFNKRTWFGLTDRQVEGTWRWVDGTSLNTSYWVKGEPNNLQGEDCALVDNTQQHPVVAWNDVPCNHTNSWICERKVMFFLTTLSLSKFHSL
uniref:C-type lectin domain-containing protein n=1 Tax=Hucho hucho TaxID=62062 RepID=A0A4W5RTP2_9TELE